jgi:hypothetical protein
MRGLASGDKAVADELGVEGLADDFDPAELEWGLGERPDGEMVVIKGQAGGVDWGPHPDLTARAHSHPFHEGRELVDVDPATGGHKIDDIVEGATGKRTAEGRDQNRVRLMPSPRDVAYMADNGIDGHVVHTPYRHVGDGVIANPKPGMNDPTVDFTLGTPVQEGGLSENLPIYKTKMTATDGQSVLWEGDVYTVDHPYVGAILSTKPFN